MKLLLLFWMLCGACAVNVAEALPCDQPPGVKGLCRMVLPRYTYKKAENECEVFFYGGCNGNENQFETQEECSKTCVKPA
ncbi:kunitz-type serine protease inhibitor-like [Drosophila miranda]|uniref:kunitz-type serine protease inhibitor-like n=1 Tax=Drosophila miranda TaxID=7229 RepID=UPI0007E7E8C4|nr:kunitz-type serine protease inhibitor-like [Drosophila miranda]